MVLLHNFENLANWTIKKLNISNDDKKFVKTLFTQYLTQYERKDMAQNKK